MENREPRTKNRRTGEPENQRSDNGQRTTDNGQLSLFEVAPNPLIEMVRRMNVNELSPLEALTKLYELQKLAKQ
jgi:hypothetical protein